MLQILALMLGLCSWAVLILSIVKRKRYKKERIYKLYFVSWILCAGALYIPSLSQFLEFRAGDFDSVIDCAATYHLASVFLLVVTAVSTILSILLQKKDK